MCRRLIVHAERLIKSVPLFQNQFSYPICFFRTLFALLIHRWFGSKRSLATDSVLASNSALASNVATESASNQPVMQT